MLPGIIPPVGGLNQRRAPVVTFLDNNASGVNGSSMGINVDIGSPRSDCLVVVAGYGRNKRVDQITIEGAPQSLFNTVAGNGWVNMAAGVVTSGGLINAAMSLTSSSEGRAIAVWKITGLQKPNTPFDICEWVSSTSISADMPTFGVGIFARGDDGGPADWTIATQSFATSIDVHASGAIYSHGAKVRAPVVIGAKNGALIGGVWR